MKIKFVLIQYFSFSYELAKYIIYKFVEHILPALCIFLIHSASEWKKKTSRKGE